MLEHSLGNYGSVAFSVIICPAFFGTYDGIHIEFDVFGLRSFHHCGRLGAYGEQELRELRLVHVFDKTRKRLKNLLRDILHNNGVAGHADIKGMVLTKKLSEV